MGRDSRRPPCGGVLQGRLHQGDRRATALPLADAKRVVHDSAAWADVRERDDELLDQWASEVEAGAHRD